MFFNQVQDTVTGMDTAMDMDMDTGMDTDMDIHGVLIAQDLVSKGSISVLQSKKLKIHGWMADHIQHLVHTPKGLNNYAFGLHMI